MTRYTVIDHTDVTPEQWNAVVHHPLQSWQWGAARTELGTPIIRIGCFDAQNNLVTGIMMTLHTIPFTDLQIGYVPRSIMPTDPLLTWIKENIATEQRLVMVKWEPDQPETSDALASLAQIQESHQLERSAHPLFPDWTMILDLEPNEETLLAQMKSKTRYNVRLAGKKGVTVAEESTDAGYAVFEELYFATTKRQRYFGHNATYHQTIWRHLREEIAHIMTARYQDQPLAAYELFCFGDTLYYPYGGTSDQHKNLMAANLLMWEAIRFGKQKQLVKFDMWGSTSPDYDSSDPYAGFTRFKEGYNAQFQKMIGSYDQVLRPIVYRIYTAAYTARNWYLNHAA